ncbi:helicase-related protein [Paramagnetospirillum magneticum]|uniref:Superfamily II DNA and RNA helicase n=1 Tax=Paramagnetospirillum magneticum (strain ATCC 700264 / AMB-1) TaxID=342108 RepID=Q2VZC6_PARM1|nr:helicase-related protein [Paramagnetospirillum magneticum]BAE53049.1 Superfamily II DNA and RNA helicase [Paramagnetospirillum magneticum AMB-1]
MTRILAVLGPTNTGKTHFAMERMLAHASGMIGFPLRLLARENYDRMVKIKGAANVALITGEEKIIPSHARWLVCTVESMPLDRRVAFLAVDEIQLCADPERGHIFTDRLLHARGESETLFLGAETIRPLIRRLVPGVEFMSRPRFSQLTHVGAKKLGRLPPRSVLVAFSAAEVYAMAEFVRRSRGGAAVVLGALSPRTRNAQVGMYQAGEVDYIVATDAIGMGLNMDVDHVAFAALRKFDGRAPRPLEPTEIAQIAGRAGRHMNDGTFGTTMDAGTIASEIVEQVENHRFDPLKTLYWRNADLRFASVAALLSSLDRPPDKPGLLRARDADDQLALAALAQDEDIIRLASHPERVKLLWEVCRVPDFRKVMDESHTRLLGRIFRYLAAPSGRLPTDWLAENIRRIDRTDGELDTIVQRIANIRTWTYVSHRSDWVPDSAHWQEVTRGVEDRLSDALHQRLTNRFVDKRTAVLVRRLRDGGAMDSEIGPEGEVRVEGEYVGRLAGFRFQVDQADNSAAGRTMLAAALRALAPEVDRRLTQALADPPEAFELGPDGLFWRGEPLACLSAGADALHPKVEAPDGDLLPPKGRERLRQRLADVVRSWLANRLPSLVRLGQAPLTGGARGLAHQLAEGLGSMPCDEALVRTLTKDDSLALARLDIRVGRHGLYIPALLKPKAQGLRALLWSIHAGTSAPDIPGPRPAVPLADGVPPAFYEAVGYGVLGKVAVRRDVLERFAALARAAAHDGVFQPSHDMHSALGLGPAATESVLEALGYVRAGDGFRTGRKPRRKVRPEQPSDSPFAVLKGRR